MALYGRIWAAVVVVTLTLLAVFVVLATLQFAQISTQLVGERLLVLASRTAAPFEAAARLGLPLGAVRNAPAVLERARQTDDTIVAIHVFDADGRIVHSTAARPPEALALRARSAHLASVTGRWYRELDDGFVSGLAITGAGGRPAGGIVIVYPRIGNVLRIRAMGAELALAALFVLLAAAAATAAVLRVGLAGPIAAFREMDETVAAYERAQWRQAAGLAPPQPAAEPAGLAHLLHRSAQRYGRAGRWLSRLAAHGAGSRPRANPGAHDHLAPTQADGPDVRATPALQTIGGRNLQARLLALLGLLLAACIVAVGTASVRAFERAVEPELVNRTRLIGTIVRAEIQQALEIGIPMNAMAGLDGYIADTLGRFDEVEQIHVRSASGAVLAQARRDAGEIARSPPAPASTDATGTQPTAFVLPVLAGNVLVGDVLVETRPRFIQTRLRDVFLDVLVVALVAVVVALELAMAIAVRTVRLPVQGLLYLLHEQARGRFLNRVHAGIGGALGRVAERLSDRAADLAARVGTLPPIWQARLAGAQRLRLPHGRPALLRLSDAADMRLVLFAYSLATEVATAFLPLYARAAQRPDWLSAELAAAAPLIVYLVGIAVLMPFGSALASRYGPRRLFALATLPSALALVGMALSEHVLTLTAWRGVLAVSYAAATVACQEYALRAGSPAGRTASLAAFITAVHAGVFCGTALGGIVADRFGEPMALTFGALVALLAGAVGARWMAGTAGNARPQAPPLAHAPARRPWALLWGVAVPLNASTAIFVWYLTPLMLAEGGSGPAETARVVMLYYLATLVFGPIVTRLSDGRTGPWPLVMAGGIVSAAALGSLGLWDGFWAITLATAGLGLGHTMVRAPLVCLTLASPQADAAPGMRPPQAPMASAGPSGLDLLRVLERVGAMAGLALIAAALPWAGARACLLALAACVGVGAVLAASHRH